MTATRKKQKRGGNYLPNNNITRSRRSITLSKSLIRSSQKTPSYSPSKRSMPSVSIQRHKTPKSPVTSTKVSSYSRKPFIFFIEGMGCTEYTEDEKLNFAEQIGVEPHETEIICNIKNPLLNIAKTTCYLQPLKNEPLLDKLADRILESAKQHKNVYVYGTSFGGMITNRIAEIFTQQFYKNGNDSTVKQNELYDLLLKIHFSTFGSIYISRKIADWIDIVNYIAIGDVANTCTRRVEHKHAIGKGEVEGKYTPLVYNFKKSKLAYNERPREESSSPRIIDICLYKRNKKNDRQFTINCNKTISHIPIVRAVNEWKVHNSYFPLIFDMMRKPTTHIERLKK